MPLITFTSDYGSNDHYVAAVKAKLLHADPGTNLVDISHDIPPQDIAQGAFILRNTYQDFPLGTIHLIAVDTTSALKNRFIVARINHHIFIAPDNGILSIIIDQKPDELVLISENIKDSFPGKNIMADAAVKLYQGYSFNVIGKNTEDYKIIKEREVSFGEDKISGHVLYIDHYGNAITNITKKIFQSLQKTRSYTITFKREHINSIHSTYNEVAEADCLVLFNSDGFLEIAINQGSAYQLLGLRYDDSVNIIFQ